MSFEPHRIWIEARGILTCIEAVLFCPQRELNDAGFIVGASLEDMRQLRQVISGMDLMNITREAPRLRNGPG